jgi:benzoylformate decarboxylase
MAYATIVDETISSGAGVRQFFRCADAKSFFGLRGGGIGWGLPAALGVKLALGDRPVVALIGDGSAMYTSQALWTAAHESLAVVYVIFNNSSYRILKQRTHALKGFSAADDVYIGMDLDRPRIDFVGLARSLGVAGGRAARAKGRSRERHRTGARMDAHGGRPGTRGARAAPGRVASRHGGHRLGRRVGRRLSGQ